MTRGAVIFAINNEATDYQSMARWSAHRIHQHLDLPVTLITDQADDKSCFDHVIEIQPGQANLRWFDDVGSSVPWHNHSRPSVYDLSPYDETLLIDADYIVASDQLLSTFDVPVDLACYRWAYDVTGLSDYRDQNWFGRNRMPMSWATVIMFRKATYAELVFYHMRMIRENWSHYRDLYGAGRSVYRNDHAVSIALSTVNGHMAEYPGLPGKLANIDPRHGLAQVDRDDFLISWDTPDGKSRHIVTKGQDLHAMCKTKLGEIIANSPS